jgi:hypothetical protein
VSNEFYSPDANHQVTKHVDLIGISNGIVWTQDAKTMYYIDTAERAVDAFDFDNVAGKVSSWQTCRDGSLAMATLDHIWGVLEPLGHPLALMGGISLAAWNHVRATRDVDLLIAIERTEVEPVLATLKSPPLISAGEHCFMQLLHTPLR